MQTRGQLLLLLSAVARRGAQLPELQPLRARLLRLRLLRLLRRWWGLQPAMTLRSRKPHGLMWEMPQS